MLVTISPENVCIGVIGLGYVGLPLAVEFGKILPTVGFDINEARVAALCAGHDDTLETSDEELASAVHLSCTIDRDSLKACNVFIVSVPTPIDKYKRPDLTPLIRASETVAQFLTTGDTVIFESTVYPGATEEECVPILERVSGLKYNEDFFAGYSPERINPGDHERRLPNIVKVTSGSTPETAAFVDALYGKIIVAGTHLTSSIAVAEAAKVIENTQRDLNIALVNELALIFEKLGIDTLEVLEAAGTKWNFLPFRPGLVGGHCIGVDPYYLTHKAQAMGYNPEVVLAGRRINDQMGVNVARRMIKSMILNGETIKGCRVLILGLAFKENCPDLRNTRVIDVVTELRDHGVEVDVYDPWVSAEEAQHEYAIALVTPKEGVYNGILLAVAHREFLEMGVDALRSFGRPDAFLFDLKSILPSGSADQRL